MTRHNHEHNHLKYEKSPYLLQHADNPVDWYPWGEAAFERARREDKPILVSIGYSTCHWCHVMADESFSDPDTAAIMNRYFVNVKVDREERPDVDRIYISAVSAMTGSAGWPLNAFLTPDGRPFYGGTYFPPKRRAHPSWKEVLTAVAEAYNDREKREQLLKSADKITDVIRKYLTDETVVHDFTGPDPELLDSTVDDIAAMYDPKNGGFGNAPKFPMPPILNFLLFYKRFAAHVKNESQKSRDALDMVVATLEKMAAGGIYDHLGGGFHRYATDPHWHVPHFEKMLYDNAQLISVYVDAYELTGRDVFAGVARESLEYVLRDMTHPDGGFYSAEDADSVYMDVSPGGETTLGGTGGKKSEGGFYVWHHDEIMHILKEYQGNDLFEVFALHHGLKPGGNVRSDPLGEFTGKNIIYRGQSITETARQTGRSRDETARMLADAKKKLFEARNGRPRPHLDDKILVEWNGLMISALANAYRVLGERRYLEAADKAVSFIFDRMAEPGEEAALYRRWRDGERKIPAMAADYAFLVKGLLDLYEAAFNPACLDRAIALSRRMMELFYDGQYGGFYTTAEAHDPNLLLKAKDTTDNVIASVDAVSAMNMMRLHRYTGDMGFQQAAERTLKASVRRVEKQPSASTAMAVALGVSMLRHVEAIVVGDMDSDAARKVRDTIRSYPREVVAPVWIREQKDRETLSAHMPHIDGMTGMDGKPRVFVCFDQACREPVAEPERLGQVLAQAFEAPLRNA